MERRPAVLYIGPGVSWKGFLEAIHREGMAAVAVIAEDYKGAPITSFLPFADLRAPGGARKLGFAAVIDQREPFNILQQAKALEGQLALHFVGVLRANEADTAVIDFVAAGLGLPHNPLKSVLARRDKAAMKEALQITGLAHAAFERILGLEQVPSVINRLGLPLVIKTPACSSSSDVFVCSTAEMVTRRVSELLGRTSPWGDMPFYVVAEQFLNGPEYAVNVFADGGGRFVVTDVWLYDRCQSHEGHVLYRSIRSVDPSSVPHACEYAVQVCNAVGITMETAHVELKLTDNGPVMIEVGARRPGGMKTELLQKMVPVWDPFVSQVRVACGLPVEIPRDFTPSMHGRHVFFHVELAGMVESVYGAPEVEALRSYFFLKLMVKAGDVVGATTDIVSCAAFLWLLSADVQQLDSDEDLARSLLKISIKDVTDGPAGKRSRSQPRA